jgi:hypothetical protein
MKKFYILSILSFFSLGAFAQNDEPTPTWTIMSENEGVRLSYQIGNCNGQDWLWYLAENTSASRKRIEFQIEVLDQGDNNMRKLPMASLVLMPGEVQMINCNIPLPHLRYISIPVKNKQLFEIELASVKIITEN